MNAGELGTPCLGDAWLPLSWPSQMLPNGGSAQVRGCSCPVTFSGDAGRFSFLRDPVQIAV